MLSDNDISREIVRGGIGIEPYDAKRLQPASIDLTLHPTVRRPSPGITVIDVARVPEGHTTEVTAQPGGTITLHPGAFILGCTAEVVSLGRLFAARVEGKSSLARLGLAVHVTGGFIDPGFTGQVTLEIVNLAPWTILLRPGMPVCQIAFQRLESSPRLGYESTGRYQGQQGATESRYTLS